MVAGGPGWTEAAAADLRAVAEASRLPVAVSFRSQDVLDNRSPSYVGDLGVSPNPALAERVRAADLVVAVGPRLGEITTGGYRLLERPGPASAWSTSTPAWPSWAGCTSPTWPSTPPWPRSWPPGARSRRSRATPGRPGRAARTNYLAWVRPWPAPGQVDLGQAMAAMRERLPDDAVVASGAGNYTAGCRFFQFRRLGTQVAPKSGAMGFGLPAALAAKVVHPGRPVVAVAGDGDFLMTGQELAGRPAPPGRGRAGGQQRHVRHHPHAPGADLPGAGDRHRPPEPRLRRPGRGLRRPGETVTDADAFPAALERALAAGRPRARPPRGPRGDRPGLSWRRCAADELVLLPVRAAAARIGRWDASTSST